MGSGDKSKHGEGSSQSLQQQQQSSPTEFLRGLKGKPILVKLSSGVDYRGIMACLDAYLNVALSETEEYVNGQLKCKYGDCFIRGNNGTL